jgi:hypothetical protein
MRQMKMLLFEGGTQALSPVATVAIKQAFFNQGKFKCAAGAIVGLQ